MKVEGVDVRLIAVGKGHGFSFNHVGNSLELRGGT